MSRVQVALNVADLDESIEFYTRLFQTGPAKVRENYANFSIAEPPLKLILFAAAGEPGTLNHIGVEVDSHRRGRRRDRPGHRRRASTRRPGQRVVLLRRAGQDVGPRPRQRLGVLHRARRRPHDGLRHHRAPTGCAAETADVGADATHCC